MKTLLQLAGFASLILWAPLALAVEGLQIRVQGNDVVLEWPSAEEENFLITYRPTYATNDAWTWLATNLPAATGTNRTVFVHTNGAECSGGSMMMMSSAGGSESLSTSSSGSPFAGKSSWPSLADYELPPLPWSEKQQAYIAETYPGLLPLLPWDTQDQQWIVQMRDEAIAQQEGGGMAMMSMSGGGCNPGGFYKVVRPGVWITELTNNYTANDWLLVPVEVGHVGSKLLEVSLMIDGQQVRGTPAIRPPFGDRYFLVDTSRYSNGDHSIQAFATVFLDQPDEYDLPASTLASQPLSIRFTNSITYPNWTEYYAGTNFWFTFSSTIFPMNWQIEVFGETTNLLRVISGTSSNGLVDVEWNLLDSNGVNQATNLFYSQLTVTPSGTNTQQSQVVRQNPQARRWQDNWAGQGEWVIARQLIFTNAPNYDDWAQIIDAPLFLGVQWGIKPSVPPRQSGYPWLIHYTNEPVAVRSNDWRTFLSAITNQTTRNLYYLGHGGTILGYDTQFGLLPGQVEIGLRTSNPSHPLHKPFRFVWLDGCATATTEWPKAFGIEPRKDVPLAEYIRTGKRPSAYCGFTQDVSCRRFIPSNELDEEYAFYRSEFVFNWSLRELPLGRAHEEAEASAPNGVIHPTGSSTLVIYGYRELRESEYNSATDWPP